MFLADFHVHSTFSDGKIPLPDVVDIYGRQGFGCIAITDHLCEEATWLGRASRFLDCSLSPATFPLYLDLLKSETQRAWDQYKMVIIPGLELTKNFVSNHRSAHVLALGVTDFMWADKDIPELCKDIRQAGGLSVAAHPVWTRKVEKQTYHIWNRSKELENSFDAWEVASGPYIFDEVAHTKLPKLASSDMHVPSQMTSWKTVLDCEKHPEAILRAIKRQEVKFVYYEEPKEKAYDPRVISPLVALGTSGRDHRMGNLVLPPAIHQTSGYHSAVSAR